MVPLLMAENSCRLSRPFMSSSSAWKVLCTRCVDCGLSPDEDKGRGGRVGNMNGTVGAGWTVGTGRGRLGRALCTLRTRPAPPATDLQREPVGDELVLLQLVVLQLVQLLRVGRGVQ
jgi:hypothetical protein